MFAQLSSMQPTIGDSLKILPKPLPASLVNSHMPKKSEEANEAKNSDKEEVSSKSILT